MSATSEPSALYIRVHGNQATLDAAAAELQRSAGRAPGQLTAEEAAATWQALNDAGAFAQVSVRLATLPSESARVLSAAQLLRHSVLQSTCAVHAGNGVARVYGLGVRSDSDFTRALLDARAALANVQGTVVLVVAPESLQERVALLPDGQAELRLMRELKKVFDPAGILSPGRFVV